ncbi:MAG TPA: hypothetical protein VFL30_04505, partial [Rhodanobacteraceae bacterium]|nr:hypothetical protein [Rhodanobacteraceae bacterium]
MKAIARLVYTSFTGTALLRFITLAGLVVGIGGAALNLYLPPLTGASGGPSRFSLALESLILLLPVAGLLSFLFGASLLPALFARLATSHYVYVLPHGRAKLLASAFATVALTACFAAGIIVMYYYKTPLSLDLIFQRAVSVSFVTVSFLYVVLWLTGKSGTIGLLVGSFVMVATLVLPLRFIAMPSTSLALPWTACAVLWGVFATGFLLAPRLKAPLGRLRHTFAQLTGSTYRGGGEIDFLIGTARPWTLAAGQVVPIAIATYVMREAAWAALAWVFFLTIISVTTGAVASVAATRGRALWLRARWTRTELFRHVENAFWRYNCWTLGVLLLLLVAIGDSLALPTRMLAFGMGLVALGTTLSTYIGLIVTARIGWRDAALAVVVILALMRTAFLASLAWTPIATVVAYEIGLAVLAFVVREL